MKIKAPAIKSQAVTINPAKDFAPQLKRAKGMSADEIIRILKQEFNINR